MKVIYEIKKRLRVIIVNGMIITQTMVDDVWFDDQEVNVSLLKKTILDLFHKNKELTEDMEAADFAAIEEAWYD